jgi:hypothetical protein
MMKQPVLLPVSTLSFHEESERPKKDVVVVILVTEAV